MKEIFFNLQIQRLMLFLTQKVPTWLLLISLVVLFWTETLSFQSLINLLKETLRFLWFHTIVLNKLLFLIHKSKFPNHIPTVNVTRFLIKVKTTKTLLRFLSPLWSTTTAKKTLRKIKFSFFFFLKFWSQIKNWINKKKNNRVIIGLSVGIPIAVIIIISVSIFVVKKKSYSRAEQNVKNNVEMSKIIWLKLFLWTFDFWILSEIYIKLKFFLLK